MKKSLIFILFFFLNISCGLLNKKNVIIHEKAVSFEYTRSFKSSKDNLLYEDFPEEDRKNSLEEITEEFSGGIFLPREGKISSEGYKEGEFLSAVFDYDTIKHKKKILKLSKIEYFKKGLRNGIFKQFDTKTGKLIYKTTFIKGTGLWKEFHQNGKPYFEAYTKDGFFTDTLKLYNHKGKIFEKRFYRRDTLFYVINKEWCLKYRYKPNMENYLEVDSYDIDTLKLKIGRFRNTFRYKSKEDYDGDYFAKFILKKM